MKTTNLGLTLTAASETEMTFLEWRTLMNGTAEDSNMQIIDQAVQEVRESIFEIDYEKELAFDTTAIVDVE